MSLVTVVKQNNDPARV